MNLKKLTVLSAIVVATTLSASAQKCNFDVDKKDDFTGAKVRNARVQFGTLFNRWFARLEQNGPKYYITVQASGAGNSNDIIPKGSKQLFRLENGSVVEVITIEDCAPVQYVQQNARIISVYNPKGEVSKEALKMLSESPTTRIRMTIAGKDYDSPELSDKEGKKIMNIAKCLLTD